MITVPAILESVATRKDKTLKLIFGTNELSPTQAGDLLTSTDKFGYLAFKDEAFTRKETDMLEDLKADYEDFGKSDSQRLRNVLFVWWKQEPQGFDSFPLFYAHHLSKLIEHFKTKLQPR